MNPISVSVFLSIYSSIDQVAVNLSTYLSSYLSRERSIQETLVHSRLSSQSHCGLVFGLKSETKACVVISTFKEKAEAGNDSSNLRQ